MGVNRCGSVTRTSGADRDLSGGRSGRNLGISWDCIFRSMDVLAKRTRTLRDSTRVERVEAAPRGARFPKYRGALWRP